MHLDLTMSIRRGDADLDLIVECDYTPGTPGRYYGPPEDCYQGDAGDVEDVVARDEATGVVVELDEDEIDRLLDRAAEAWAEDAAERRWRDL